MGGLIQPDLMQPLVVGRVKLQLDPQPRVETMQRLHGAEKILTRRVWPWRGATEIFEENPEQSRSRQMTAPACEFPPCPMLVSLHKILEAQPRREMARL
jgi:hypothetical protein